MESAILLVFQDCVPKTGCIEWGMLLVESMVSLYFFFTSTSLWQLRIALAVSHHMITHLETRGNIKVEFVKITFQINNFFIQFKIQPPTPKKNSTVGFNKY